MESEEPATDLTTENSTLLDEDGYPSNPCEAYYFALRGVVCAIFCVVGIAGNGLSLAVLKHIGRSSITFFLLKMVAVVDTIYLTTSLISIVTPEIMQYAKIQAFSSGITYIIWYVVPIASMALTCTIWITTLVTYHRYKAISGALRSNPYTTMYWVRIQVTIIVILAILIDIPRYVDLKIIHFEVANKSYVSLMTTQLWSNEVYQILYKNITMVVLRKLLPLIFTAVFTYKLVNALYERNKIRAKLFHRRENEAVGRQAGPNHGESVTTVLIAIAGTFIVCQAPMAIYPIFRVTLESEISTCGFFNYFSTIADALAILNSAVNFFIYYPSIPVFRKTMSDLLSRRIRQENYRPPETIVSRSPSPRHNTLTLNGTTYTQPTEV